MKGDEIMVVGFNLDGTLNNFSKEITEAFKKYVTEKNLLLPEYHRCEYDLSRQYPGLPEEIYTNFEIEFQRVAQRSKIIPEAAAAIHRLWDNKIQTILITSRPETVRFRIATVNALSEAGITMPLVFTKNKVDAVQMYKVDYMVEDSSIEINKLLPVVSVLVIAHDYNEGFDHRFSSVSETVDYLLQQFKTCTVNVGKTA